MDWLLISCIASFALAIALGLALFIAWRHGQPEVEPFDEPFGDCPWPHRGDL